MSRAFSLPAYLCERVSANGTAPFGLLGAIPKLSHVTSCHPTNCAALEGCDAVVHCATGPRAVIVEGTRNVLAAAQEMKLRRAVHLSSVAVYGKATGVVDERRVRRGDGNSYAKSKIAAEQICEQFIAGGARS